MKLSQQIRVGMLLAFLISKNMFAQVNAGAAIKDDLFTGTEKFAQNASSVTQIDMDPSSLRQVRGGEQNQAKRMLLSIVHTYEYDSPGMYKMADVEVYRRKLQSPDWHCSVQMHDAKTGNSSDVCSKVRSDGNLEEAVISVQPKMLTFIHTVRKPKQPAP